MSVEHSTIFEILLFHFFTVILISDKNGQVSLSSRIALVGAGAFGEKHLVGLKNIPDAEVVTVVSASEEESRKLAEPHGISDVSDSYEATLRRDDIDAVILTTPTPMHARQAIQAMDAGKHVEVEIPVADSWAAAQAVMICLKRTNPASSRLSNPA